MKGTPIAKDDVFFGYIQWDEDLQIAVDEQGLMIPLSAIEAILPIIEKMQAYSPLEREALGRRSVEKYHPNMVPQFNFDYFKE